MLRKKLFSLALVVTLAFVLLSVNAFAAEDAPELVDGYYEIYTADQLYWFAAQVNGGDTAINGKLMADIVVNENVLNADGTLNGDGSNFRVWTPIGNSSYNYNGVFEGNGKTVSGLYFNDISVSYVGLFGFVSSSGVIQNIGVVASYFDADRVGAIASANYGAIINCYSTGMVKGSCNVGGIVGTMVGKTATISNCYNTGGIIGDYYVGGVVGNSGNYATVSNCYNTGSVIGIDCVGGVVGDNYSTISNCYNTATVSGDYCVGGVVGNNTEGTISNSYNVGAVSGSNYVGGVVGDNFFGTIGNCYYLSDCITEGNAYGKVMNEKQFASGEVAYFLQGNQSEQVWGQYIGVNPSPILGGKPVHLVDGQYVNLLCQHSYQAVVTQPTCTEAGYTTYICVDCSDSYVDNYTDAIGHDYNAVVVASGCTTDGYTIYTCESCGHSYRGAYIEASGHSWKEATCTQPMYCATCGVTRGDALGHLYREVITAPDCVNGGYTTYTCTACGDSYVADEVAALGHTWTDATCTAPKTCSVCGVTEGEALGHSFEAVVTAPTCTEAGYTTYTCACGDSYVADEVAALGHTWTDATCTAPKTCSVCGATEGEALGHSYEAVVTAPTCTEAGFTTYTCACGDSYVAEEVAALGHTWTDATCTAPKTCSVCGETEGEALGHAAYTYSYDSTNKLHNFTCTLCGETVTKTAEAKFGFNTASPALAVDIVMNIATTLPTDFSDPYMVVEFNGVTTTLTDYTINADNGRYVFAFPGINPQIMGDTFVATLYAKYEGVDVSVNLEYSMLKYLDSQLKKLTEASTLRTALSDLIMYGDANQVYEGYKTDALLSTLLSDASKANLDPSTFPGLDESYNKQVTAGVKDANIDLKGVTMALGSKIMVRMTVFCADAAAYTVKVTINGEDFLYPVSELALAAGYTDRYVVEFDQIRATQFGEEITFSFLDADGNQVGRTLTYTVYTYVQKNQAAENENLVNLLKAIYNYGESVKKI